VIVLHQYNGIADYFSTSPQSPDIGKKTNHGHDPGESAGPLPSAIQRTRKASERGTNINVTCHA
jgi:hypothetical protein